VKAGSLVIQMHAGKLFRREHLYLHKAVERTDALDADLRASKRNLNASHGIQGIPVFVIIVEHRNSRLAVMIRRFAEPVQGDRIGRVEPECRVVGLDPVTPDATIRTVHQLGVGIDRQEHASATTVCAVGTYVVIWKRGIPVTDQQAVLVREMLDQVVQGRITRPTEVIGVG